MATLRNDTVMRSADGQTMSAMVTAANIGTYGVAANSTYYVGTTQNIFNRAHGAQTLTGVSIDGNAATVSYPFNNNNALDLNSTGATNQFSAFNVYYPSGGSYNQPIGGSQHFKILQFGRYNADDVNYWRGQMAMSFYTDRMFFRKEYTSTWGSWMEFLHTGNYAGYSAFTASLTSTVDARAPIFYDSNDTSYYLDAANSGTSLLVAGKVGIGTTSPATKLEVASTSDGILTLNKSSGTAWNYINFSQAGTRRFYFGLNASFEPELGVDNGGTFRVVGGMTVAGNAVLTSTSTLTAGNLSGTIPSGVLGNSTHYVGTTAIALNRASASQTLTGVSIDGNAATATNVAWSGITSKPTTFSGFGISDLIYGSTGSRNVWTITNWNQTTYPNAHFLSSEGNTTNAPSTDFIYGLQTAFHRDGASYRTQMVSELYSSPVSIWVRNSRDSDVWTAWSKLLHSNNYSSYSAFTASLTSTVDARAPIFYDSNNTAYYIDAASTSNLNALTIAGNSTFSADSYLTFGPNSSWSRYLRIGGNGYTAPVTTTASVVTTNGNLHLDAAKAANAIYLNWYGGTSGTIFGNGSGTQVGAVDGSVNTSFSGTLSAVGAITQNGNQVLNASNYVSYSAFTGSVTSTYGNFTSPGLIIGDAQYGFYVSGGNIYYKSASGGVHYWRNIANSANTMSLDNSGNILLSGYVNASSYVYSATYLQTGGNLIYPSGYGATQRLEVSNSANNNWIDGLTIAPGGTVTAPDNMRSPIFYDSNNTAYYLDPANTGTSLLVAGKVGIGTTSPLKLLHVHGTNGEVVRLSMASSYTAGNGPQLSFWNATSEELASIRGVFNETGQGNRANLIFGTRTSDALGVETKMTILHNGNVGIGTTSPAYKLDVAGSIRSYSGTYAGELYFGTDSNADIYL